MFARMTRCDAVYASQDPCLYTCKLGFHHVPSMRQLHMHVISQVGLSLSHQHLMLMLPVLCCAMRVLHFALEHAGWSAACLLFLEMWSHMVAHRNT